MQNEVCWLGWATFVSTHGSGNCHSWCDNKQELQALFSLAPRMFVSPHAVATQSPCVPRAGLPSWEGCVCFWGHVLFACCSVMDILLFSPACLRDRAMWQGCAHLFPHCFPTSCQSFCLCFRSHQVVLDWWLMQKYSPPSLPTPSFVQGTARTIISVMLFIPEDVPLNASRVVGVLGLGWGWSLEIWEEEESEQTCASPDTVVVAAS